MSNAEEVRLGASLKLTVTGASILGTVGAFVLARRKPPGAVAEIFLAFGIVFTGIGATSYISNHAMRMARQGKANDN
ncbi:hypothetical protein QKT49_gp020 [Acanthamoeba castellanii medusavirus]|uniref:Uncharacterized protein n=1 Tax=Acanthamoeba castellanii medusavirus J1 TaxID=3114988 RepID=A0A3T1CWE6_9VIRU|nr:hypothetical protein QKT49_gp020 [Acanthamoeba castellanii medusavirus]BBI30160.1 hypothetical protein [Acanthamoeba castellanii medusavirus J1]